MKILFLAQHSFITHDEEEEDFHYTEPDNQNYYDILEVFYRRFSHIEKRIRDQSQWTTGKTRVLTEPNN